MPSRVTVVQPTLPRYRVPFFRAIAKRGSHDVHLICGRDGQSSPDGAALVREAGVQYQEVRTITLAGRRAEWQCGVQLPPRSGPDDVLVVSGNPRILSNLPLVFAARALGMGVVWWGLGWSPGKYGLSAKARMALMRRVADVWLLYSDSDVEGYIQRGFPRSRCVSIRNTLDQAPIRQQIAGWTPDRLRDFHAEYGLEGSRILLYCGRLTPKAEVGRIIELMPEAKKRVPSLRLAVVGDGPCRKKIETRARVLGVAQDIMWIGSAFEEGVVAPWFLSARAFVYPGAGGLSLHHALAYGLPVITHSNRRMHSSEYDAVKDGVNARLYERGRPDTAVDAIAQVCMDDLLHRRLSEGAWETMARDYGIDQMADRFLGAVSIASDVARKRRTADKP